MAAKKAQSVLTWEKVADPRAELASLAGSMGDDECRILVRVARRLKFGEGRYGPLNLAKDRRDFMKEAAEEVLDWLVYVEGHEERKEMACRRKTARPRTKRGA